MKNFEGAQQEMRAAMFLMKHACEQFDTCDGCPCRKWCGEDSPIYWEPEFLEES
jgi:hypothetical protein